MDLFSIHVFSMKKAVNHGFRTWQDCQSQDTSEHTMERQEQTLGDHLCDGLQGNMHEESG
jgi:hypothetical protein